MERACSRTVLGRCTLGIGPSVGNHLPKLCPLVPAGAHHGCPALVPTSRCRRHCPGQTNGCVALVSSQRGTSASAEALAGIKPALLGFGGGSRDRGTSHRCKGGRPFLRSGVTPCRTSAAAFACAMSLALAAACSIASRARAERSTWLLVDGAGAAMSRRRARMRFSSPRVFKGSATRPGGTLSHSTR